MVKKTGKKYKGLASIAKALEAPPGVPFKPTPVKTPAAK
jgi:hypothetical protein